ncbi:Pseudouridine synthase [Candidatus Terasakiella magnetica]|uniref:Pseudouridine synthase n=1 Tax=Candidatus Terasakiella magnetica TaxID=1867952 RepID=A0A1C3RDC6_9PROT|nr:RluA family pseudouridine synthase [Candidatus Terasakiella magnetica]SCA55269.1 Pseudouridine synthase [Candidatus Terasakiella magnetica]
MSGVKQVTVSADDDDIRLDRWFKRHYPELSYGRLEKLLRKGQIRLDGKRAKSKQRITKGQVVRVPPFGDEGGLRPIEKKEDVHLSEQEIDEIRSWVLYRDDDVIVINKPAGLPTQGGTGIKRHLDGLLHALKYERADKPRLCHRLDKDTSGVLVLARSANVAAQLTKSFKTKDARKLYWALTVKVPNPRDGKVFQPIAKYHSHHGERMVIDADEGKDARTMYRTIESTGNVAAWVALEPLTGRTHQLRVHCAYLKTPIQGDGKYGGQDAYLTGDGVSKKMHLHARRIQIPSPDGVGVIDVTAPLPEHMIRSWDFFDFDTGMEEADELFDLSKKVTATYKNHD